jgi:hypothetical protein
MTGANQTAAWPAGRLGQLGAAEEIGLASRRADGSLRLFVTMWVMRAGDGLYVRSAYGPNIVGSVTGPASHAVTIRLLPESGK